MKRLCRHCDLHEICRKNADDSPDSFGAWRLKQANLFSKCYAYSPRWYRRLWEWAGCIVERIKGWLDLE